MSHAHRAGEPCDSYFGNVCTGFGAEAVCDRCGWDRSEHPEAIRRAREAFEKAGLPWDHPHHFADPNPKAEQ